MANTLLLTVKEAAPLLGVSEYTLYEMVKRSEIPVIRNGRAVYISRPALMKRLGVDDNDPNPNPVRPSDKAAHSTTPTEGS